MPKTKTDLNLRYDDVKARALLQNVEALPNYLYTAAAMGAGAIKYAMIAEYMKASVNSKPNTEATIANKAQAGGAFSFETLHATGSVLEALKNAEVDIRAGVRTMKTGKSGIGMSGKYAATFPEAGRIGWWPPWSEEPLKREDTDYIYIWSHEFGVAPTSNMRKFGIFQWGTFEIPKRPFIAKGLQRGAKQAARLLSTALQRWKKNLRFDKLTTGLSPEREFNIKAIDVAMLVAPPSGLYAIAGAGSDITGLFHGSFTDTQIGAWVGGFAKGQGGITKKVQRRRARRMLWT